MRARAARLCVWLLIMLAAPAPAVPPSYCRQHLAGVLRSDTRGQTRVRVRLVVRNDVGDLSLGGRFHCAPRPQQTPCVVGTARVGGFSRSSGSLPLGRAFTIYLYEDGPAGARTACTLDATVPFMPGDCVATLTGTYECTGADGTPDRGVFGLLPDRRDACPAAAPPASGGY